MKSGPENRWLAGKKQTADVVVVSTSFLVRVLQINKFSFTLNFFRKIFKQRLWLCVYWKFANVQKTFAW